MEARRRQEHGAEKPRRPKKRLVARGSDRLEHFECYYGIKQLQHEQEQTQESHAVQQQELQESHALRCQNVQEYTLDLGDLRAHLGESADLLESADPIGHMEPLMAGAPRGYVSAAAVHRDWEEAEQLARRVAERREEIRALRRQALDARRAACEEEARLRVREELHAEEVAFLRAQLPPWPPEGAQGPEVELESARRAAAEESMARALDELAAQQARARLEAERKLHREEMELLARLRARCGHEPERLPGRGATPELRRELEALDAPFSELLTLLGEPALPPAPKSTGAAPESAVGLERWVGVLAGRLSALSDRLAAEGAARARAAAPSSNGAAHPPS